MKSIVINGTNLSKSFFRKNYIFRDINFEVKSGEVLGICGPNGSGKSTLLKIIIGLVKQSSGVVEWKIDDKKIDEDSYFDHYGFAAPYLNLYEEFTPLELIAVLNRLRGLKLSSEQSIELLKKFYLAEHKNKAIRNFSSGMKQRMKLLTSLFHSPKVLILDEPSTNLDTKGIELVFSLIEHHKQQGGAVLLASNDESELSLCNNRIYVSKN